MDGHSEAAVGAPIGTEGTEVADERSLDEKVIDLIRQRLREMHDEMDEDQDELIEVAAFAVCVVLIKDLAVKHLANRGIDFEALLVTARKEFL